MKDMVIDLVYNWKHSMSKENTKGTRTFCIFVFAVCVATILAGLVSVSVAIITKKMVVLAIGLPVMALGIGIFAFMSRQ